jgi:hypothetical protein
VGPGYKCSQLREVHYELHQAKKNLSDVRYEVFFCYKLNKLDLLLKSSLVHLCIYSRSEGNKLPPCKNFIFQIVQRADVARRAVRSQHEREQIAGTHTNSRACRSMIRQIM